jgi:hypothetical protein
LLFADYRACEGEHTYTMCLRKKRFLALLDEFPDARRYYEQRAIDRRIEFRRVSPITPNTAPFFSDPFECRNKRISA